MKKILVTGFVPFNGQAVNPSELLVKALEPPEGAELERLILPVEFRGAGMALEEAAGALHPDVLLSIGQAGNAPCLAVERVAVNLDSSLSADGRTLLVDNSGFAPVDEPICPEGPAAYFSQLPARALVEALDAAGIPARVSYSAGTYVCNHVMYLGCRLAERYGGMSSGFVHVPFLPEQLPGPNGEDGKYSLPFPEMLKGIRLILAELAKPASTQR